MVASIILNGKYLSAAPTGVHRVANEIGRALADLAAENHPSMRDIRVVAWLPQDASLRCDELPLASRVVRGLSGIAWEQLTLPARAGEHLLLNLCNIGPILCSRAVTMIHDAQVYLTPESYSRPFRAWYRFVQPLLAQRNRRILTVSEFSRRELIRAGVCRADKISVVHNGADHIGRVSADRSMVARLGVSPNNFVLGFSSLQAHKNVRLLLRAFAAPELSRLALVLVGSTGRKAFLRAGLEVPPNVRFAGPVSDSGLRGLIEDALCLAFPSKTEGFGLPPLEAMSLGTPAIVAPCGALPEVCGDAAIYAAADDPAAWVRALVDLAGAPAERMRVAESGRDRARRFTWRNSALRLIEELRPLL
jgi:glycosyltransferase involved in cell wall biosynthesis